MTEPLISEVRMTPEIIPKLEEYLKKSMSRERAAQLDAETPPFKPETREDEITILRKTGDDGLPLVRGPAIEMPDVK